METASKEQAKRATRAKMAIRDMLVDETERGERTEDYRMMIDDERNKSIGGSTLHTL